MAKIRIHSPSDTADQPRIWRDARVKHSLAEALVTRGHSVVYEDADVEIWLWGWTSTSIDSEAKNIFWVISHPALLENNISILKELKRVSFFSASKSYPLPSGVFLPNPAPIRVVSRGGFNVEYDLSFIGNASSAKGREGLVSFFNAYKSHVVGPGWSGAKGGWCEWGRMPDVWNSSKLVPYTHYKDMAENGFVAEAALDVMVNSEALLLSDFNSGWKDLGIPVPMWNSAEQLEELIQFYLKNEDARKAKVVELKRKAGVYTYGKVAKEIEKAF